MASPASFSLLFLLHTASLVSAQAACYWAAGAQFRIPASAKVVPCNNEGPSQCCRLGDTCLEGNACYDYTSGDVYQYGCTDVTYKDKTCPFKCGWNPEASPWVALEYCESYGGINATWNCQSPESCGCEWRATYELLVLPPRQCTGMGSLARVALYHTTPLPAWAQLPSTSGGSIAYFSSGATGSTPVAGYTPNSLGPPATISAANKVVQYDATATPLPSAGTAVLPNGSQPPIPTFPTTTPSSDILGGSSFSHSSSTPATTTTQSSNPSQTSSAQSTTSSGSNGGSTTSSSLSTGAKVGLGVGIAGGVCLIAAIILVAVVMRKRKHKAIADATVYSNDKRHHDADADAYYDPYNRGANVHEAPYTPQEEASMRKRMGPSGFVAELDSGQPIHELDSNAGSGLHTPAGEATSAR